MAEPSALFIKTVHHIDDLNDRFGRVVAWAIFPLTFGLTWEVIARYGFNAPTYWAFDMTYYLTSILFMFGAAYALLKGGHIRTDMLWQNWSVRRRAYIDFFAYLLFFFPGILMFFFSSLDDAIYSYSIWERSEQTAWRPPIWPLKAIIPITMALLLLQGLSEFLKCIHAIRTGQVYDTKEGFEV